MTSTLATSGEGAVGPPGRVVFSSDAFVQPVGGISRYTAELHSELRRQGVRSVIVAGFHWNDYLSKREGVVGVRLPQRSRRAAVIKGTTVVNQWGGRVAVSLGSKPVVLHPTYYTAPIPRCKVRSVVTVHDMIHELFPTALPASEAGIAGAKRGWCARASRIIAVSNKTRDDLLEMYPVDPDRVVVIYPGIDSRPRPDYGSPRSRPYVLHVGNRRWYKNFGPLLEAFGESAAAREFDFVVFGGEPLEGSEKAAAKSLGVRLYRVAGSDSLLGAHYQYAHAFMCASRYEGFGFPPLEAMSFGCPVMCSTAGSLLEVVGDAAITFDPDERQEMMRAVLEVCFDDSRRSELRRRGVLRAARYTWSAAARATAGLYRSLWKEV